MSFVENATPVSPADACFQIKNSALKTTSGSSNWTILSSSDGARFAAQGDVITSTASLTTVGAWWVQQARGYKDQDSTFYTQLCWQVDGAGGLRLKISPRLGFTGGTPGLTRTPSAADEQYWLGGGTDASPTYTAFVPSPGQRMQGWWNENDETMFFVWYPVGGGPASALMFIDRSLPNPKGSGGNLLDKERIEFYARTGSNCALCADIASEATGPRSFFRYGELQALWGRCPPIMEYVFDASGTARKELPGGVATEILYGEATVEETPFRYRRRAAVSGVSLPGEVGDVTTVGSKGSSIWFRFGGQTKSQAELLDSVDPSTGQVVTGGTLAIGDVLLPWNGATLLL